MSLTLDDLQNLTDKFKKLTGLEVVILHDRNHLLQIQDNNSGFYRGLHGVSDLETLIDVIEKMKATGNV